MFGMSVYALYLCAGWLALTRGIAYPPAGLRREMAQNGVSDSQADRAFNAMLALAYLFVLHVWPVAVYRKLRHGRVVGK
jgi:hypothetical protein